MRQKDETEDNTKYKDGVNRNARLIVRNISFKATEEALKKHFEPYGTVEEVKLLKNNQGKLVGCGFVHFTHVPMANKALVATNKKPFLGRPVYVAWAISQDKYVQKLQSNKKHPFSSGVIPEIEDSKKDRTSDENIKDKPKADKSKPRVNRNARLIVRNISFKATEESLKEHFAPHGEILEVNLLKKPDGKLVGCAFILYKNVPMAKKALLNANMKPFLGRPISVDWAIAKNKYMQHVVGQETEMQDKVKKEDPDSDSDDDQKPPINITGDDLKSQVKSESEETDDDDDDDDDDGDDDEKVKSESKNESDDSDEEGSEEDEIDESKEEYNEPQSPVFKKRFQLNDAEDGFTVFVTNVSFEVDNDRLLQYAEQFGPVKYALVCVDKLTEHSKGTGFIKFDNKEDADRFLALPAEQLKLEGQVLQVKPALKKESLQKNSQKQPKDNRNLYLVKEGVIIAGTKAAVGLSASDMAKRLALERSKTQMLKNLNRFVSRYRLVVSNLPSHFDDKQLRAVCSKSAPGGAVITEARVMRDLRAPTLTNGTHPSKGYGFVMFMRHEDALACLRKMNNNPDIFDKNNRPIVSFSIEDRTALNARKKRLEKSIANNPQGNNSNKDNEFTKRDNFQDEGNRRINRKRKNEMPDETFNKKKKGGKQIGGKQDGRGNFAGRFVRKPADYDEFTGLTARAGSQHNMRSNQKLRKQADVHRQTVKAEKKTSKRTLRLKMAAKERVKQPKQKVNKNPKKGKGISEKKVRVAIKESNNFSDLVSKYKSKIAGNNLVKSKWYEN